MLPAFEGRMSVTIPPLEICLSSADSARAAQEGGAVRVELCDNLVEGGTTPSLGMVRATRRAIGIDLMVMIRPRGGDFCYTPAEVEAMEADIDVARAEGAQGVVFGMLSPDGTVDRELTARLVRRAGNLWVTFHRAFDMTRDPLEALETLIELGVQRVLTSGQEPTVLEGLDLITRLVQRAGDRIVVLPGGGITPGNVQQIVQTAHPKELHVSANEELASPMRWRNDRISMGSAHRCPEYLRKVTSAARVRALRGEGCQGDGEALEPRP
jgi:copper homeostasis protein